MKNQVLLLACFVLLFLVGDAAASGRKQLRDRRNKPKPKDDDEGLYKMFIFGDTYADTGNINPDADLNQPYEFDPRMLRGWSAPYGKSDALHKRQPTGRFSDGLVQSDYFAKILGRDESPPSYQMQYNPKDQKPMDTAGVNFATGGCMVLPDEDDRATPRFYHQLNHFDDFVTDGVITDADVRGSVALVAFSGPDYEGIGPDWNRDDITALVENVTDHLAHYVRRLHSNKTIPYVVVNMLHPLGCVPWMSRGSNYTECDTGDFGNFISDTHNRMLKAKLAGEPFVLLLDLHTIFTQLVTPAEGSTLASRFDETMRACCESFKDEGYCGETSEDNTPQYTLCEDPTKYFYWDGLHPSQAGWKAVMQLLQGPIMAFLQISNLNHF